MGDDALAIKSLKAVIVGRLVRRLCSACKVGYTPDPNTLRKLNMNPDSVGKLYQARKEPMRDAKGNAVPCTFCNDLAFKGRFGIFEVMVIDDEIRKVIAAGGNDSQIKQAQREAWAAAAGSGAGAGAGGRDERGGSIAGVEAGFGVGRFTAAAEERAGKRAGGWETPIPRRHARAARTLAATEARGTLNANTKGTIRSDPRPTPSPGTPGEGGGEGFSGPRGRSNPHPNPLPEYRERGKSFGGSTSGRSDAD